MTDWYKTPEQVEQEKHDAAAHAVRVERDRRFTALSNLVERYNSQVRLGEDPTDRIEDLDNHAQQLRDVTKQEGFPFDVTWPELPEN